MQNLQKNSKTNWMNLLMHLRLLIARWMLSSLCFYSLVEKFNPSTTLTSSYWTSFQKCKTVVLDVLVVLHISWELHEHLSSSTLYFSLFENLLHSIVKRKRLKDEPLEKEYPGQWSDFILEVVDKILVNMFRCF